MSPVVLLADEPTGNLDSKTGSEILSLLREINHELSSTLVMVTHDASAAAVCDRILRLRDGRLDVEVTLTERASR
jgi:putative ABC transport system ATP-binding protein